MSIVRDTRTHDFNDMGAPYNTYVLYPFLFIDRNARIARRVFGLSSTAAIAAFSCVVIVFIVAIEHRARSIDT